MLILACAVDKVLILARGQLRCKIHHQYQVEYEEIFDSNQIVYKRLVGSLHPFSVETGSSPLPQAKKNEELPLFLLQDKNVKFYLKKFVIANLVWGIIHSRHSHSHSSRTYVH